VVPSGARSPRRRMTTLSHLRRALDHAAHLLPAQGPITVFIHHNTLHAFEDLPFDPAVARGAAVFGCQPYLTEEAFRGRLARGRITTDDLRAVLRASAGSRSPATAASTTRRRRSPSCS
jgi:uncharacterized protein